MTFRGKENTSDCNSENSMSERKQSEDAETKDKNNIVVSLEDKVENLMNELKLKENKILSLDETIKCLQEQLKTKDSNSSSDTEKELLKANETKSQDEKLNCHENSESEDTRKKIEHLENEIKTSDDKLKLSYEKILALEKEVELKNSAFDLATEEISNLKKQLKSKTSELHEAIDENKCLEIELEVKNNNILSSTEKINSLQKENKLKHDELETAKKKFYKELEAKNKELKLVKEDIKFMRSCYNKAVAKRDRSINTEMDMWSIRTFVPKKDKSSQTTENQITCSSCKQTVCYATVETQTFEELDISTTKMQLHEMEVDPSAENEDSYVPEESEETPPDIRRRTDEAIASNPDYIFIETLKIYYSSSTGFYYDPQTGISTDSRTGTKYVYNPDTQAYCLFIPKALSQQTLVKHLTEQLEQNKRKIPMPEKPSKILKSEENEVETEDKNSKMTESIENDDNNSQSVVSYLQEQAKLAKAIHDAQQVPPSIRCIVLESETLQKGSLLLVTYTGVLIGRDESCTMCIPDSDVSQTHARIDFDTTSNSYVVTDLGSENGTYLNYYRLSESQEQSEPCYLSHEDYLSVAKCKLLVHIHKGTETCNNCEPGQVHDLLNKIENKDEKDLILSKEDREIERRKVLKTLKKRFALDNAQFEDTKLAKIENLGYKDLAKERQKTKGSDNPYEKTEVQSVDQSLTAKNKGFQLLQKMGWTEGKGLGKTSSGRVEPVPIPPSVPSSTVKKKPVMSKAAMRHFQREISKRSGNTNKPIQPPFKQSNTSVNNFTPVNFTVGTSTPVNEQVTPSVPQTDPSKLENRAVASKIPSEVSEKPADNGEPAEKQTKTDDMPPTDFLTKLVGKKTKKKRRCREMVDGDLSQASQS